MFFPLTVLDESRDHITGNDALRQTFVFSHSERRERLSFFAWARA
jgi:hypothetical protein